VYGEEEARRLAKERGWTVARDGDHWRRVVASPLPKRIFEIRPVRWLLEKGTIVICGGGGGIPTVYGEGGKLQGVEAVIDKDRVASLLAQQLDADAFIMATDVPAVVAGWGTKDARAIRRVSPAALSRFDFATGSMGPKVQAARDFAERTGKTAGIGSLEDIPRILLGEAGTIVSNDIATIEWASSQETLFRD
jgi:carbamate kinase